MFEVITIDGPSCSGKGTLAKLLAEALGWVHLDSGLFYRALSYICLDQGLLEFKGEPLKAVSSLIEISVQSKKIAFNYRGEILDTTLLRTPEIASHASLLAKTLEVREQVKSWLYDIAEKHSCIADGRDMGSVVFPKAKWKFYLVASLQTRARRRLAQLRRVEGEYSLEQIQQQIEQRDLRDTERLLSPLQCPKDAVKIDTERKEVHESLFEILSLMKGTSEIS